VFALVPHVRMSAGFGPPEAPGALCAGPARRLPDDSGHVHESPESWPSGSFLVERLASIRTTHGNRYAGRYTTLYK